MANAPLSETTVTTEEVYGFTLETVVLTNRLVTLAITPTDVVGVTSLISIAGRFTIEQGLLTGGLIKRFSGTDFLELDDPNANAVASYRFLQEVPFSVTGSLEVPEVFLTFVTSLEAAFESTGSGVVARGSDFDDSLWMTAHNDRARLGDGDDWLNSGAGDDIVAAGRGNDYVVSGDGNDIVRGNAGKDWLIGGNGQDRLFGGSGKDILDGGNGRDFLFGDTGRDALSGGGGHDELSGGDGNDLMNGDAGNDVLNGGTGDDALIGGDGDDILNGGRGRDLLMGDGGHDIATGGAGADYFVFSNYGSGNSTTITDFTSGVDKILGSFVDWPTTIGEDLANGGAEYFTQTADGVIFDYAGPNRIMFSGLQLSDLSGDDFAEGYYNGLIDELISNDDFTFGYDF